jgi:hypothetical protein
MFYPFSSGQEDIVKDGLVLWLDAGDRTSYPGGGNVWRDLTPNANNGTLINGPTFNSLNGGNLIFDGVDDYVNSNYEPFLQSGGSYSQGIWFRSVSATAGDGGSNRLIEARDGNKTGSPIIASIINWLNPNTVVFLVRGQNGTRRDLIIDDVPVTDGKWRYAHFQILANGHTQIYLDGVLAGTNSLGVDTNINLQGRPLAIGARNLEGNISAFFSGNISNVQIYNRPLSANEVSQNFNATRSRFGV